jgi:hypothetical protein
VDCTTLYKYFLAFIAFKLLSNYFIGESFPKRTNTVEDNFLPKEILIHELFSYLGTFIISSILLIYDCQSRKYNIGNIRHEFNIRKKSKNPAIIPIFDREDSKISCFSLIIIFIGLFLTIQFKIAFYNFSLDGLDFWFVEIGFLCFWKRILFGMLTYLHHIFSINFIIIICTILKALSFIIILLDDKYKRLYKDYNWIIFVGIISFLLMSLLKSYVIYKIKWIMNFKYYSSIKFLLFYGLIGTLICFGLSIVSNEMPCIDDKTFKDIHFICQISKTDKDNNTTYYYDNYSVFFDNFGNAFYVVLYIIKIIASFGVRFYSILILKYLSPEHLICANSLYFFMIRIIDLFIFLIQGKKNEQYDYNSNELFELFINFFHFLGSIIYLEFIELKFCQLNYNLKKNIVKRAQLEMRLVKEDDDSSDISINDNIFDI